MLIPFLLAALAAPTAASPPPAPRPAAAESCIPPGVTFAVKERKGATGAQKLNELPPANLYLSVQRNVGGCPAPAIVQTGIGG